MDILRAARQRLDFAAEGWNDYLLGGSRRPSGLHNFVTHGRGVTFVIQNLRGKANGFDDWYSVIEKRLRADPVCVWFKDLRNQMEKQGRAETASAFMGASFSPDDLMRSAPPGTVGIGIGDSWGRSQYNVQLADGSVTEVYFTVPDWVGSVTTYVKGAPDGRPIEELGAHYLAVLEDILDDAESSFG